ncbi:putative protein TPRXL [Penaeus chinensis]|uniref:putative protein TPRXL n=1 Tax=Penaeus chinensis TaxID=139456 RepID=UPI001FB7D5CF|nr:putative protein TPRXL [Penaeus chinensis]
MFLINIVRILVTKLRASDAQVRGKKNKSPAIRAPSPLSPPFALSYRKAIKATVVLFPLLGTTNLLFAVNPGDKGEGAYMVTNAPPSVLAGGWGAALSHRLAWPIIGVFVSVLYCFLNTEVRKVVQKRWRQHRLRRLGYPDSERRKSTKSTIILPSTFSFRRPTSHNINLQLPPSPRPTSPQSSSVVQAHVSAHAHQASFPVASQPPAYLAISLHSPSSSSSSSRPPCAFALATHTSPSGVFEPLALDSFPSRLCPSPTQTLTPSMQLPYLPPASALRHAPSDASSLNHAPFDAYPSDACPSPLSSTQQSLETSLL